MSALTFVMRPDFQDLFLMKQLREFSGNMSVTLLREERILTREYYMAHMGLENLIYLLCLGQSSVISTQTEPNLNSSLR